MSSDPMDVATPAPLKAGSATTRTRAGEDQPATTGRFAGRQPPTLGWIFCYVFQEYARNLGHLDVVIELAGGSTGE
jgi:hypothetical protein